MDIVLIPGLWLDGASWDRVAAELTRAGHRPHAVTLPGLQSADTDRSGITLTDHVEAVVAAIEATEDRVAVVGHSAGAILAFCAADARPERVAHLIYVGGFPASDGEPFMTGLEADGADVPFPGWQRFEGPDTVDLDEATRTRLAEGFVPVPAGVLSGAVRLSDPRRYDIPATLVCPEFTPDDVRRWLADGELPELAATEHLELVDIDSGHWPQITQPARLAQLIVAAVAR